jgi:hypothetical protein
MGGGVHDAFMTMHYSTPPILTDSLIAIRAPVLARFVDAAFAKKRSPRSIRAKIVLALIVKEEGDRCPCCAESLTLDTYRETETPYYRRRMLTCVHCRQDFIIDEEHVV